MTKKLRVSCWLLLALAACGRDTGSPQEAAPTASRPEPVVVYAAHHDPTFWPEIFAGFTRETGIRVTVRHRDAATIVSEVINNHGSPPADILLTPSVHGVWLAAEEGALRPLDRDVLATRVDEALRDPDGYWAPVRVHTATVTHAADFAAGVDVTDFADLGDAAYAGKLCLTSSSLPLNRVLIAGLIDHHGAREAELTVRRWMRNLALPPFDDESSLHGAIADGRCKLGILSADAASGLAAVTALAGSGAVVDIDGIGIARHAREPESAMMLVEWLLGSTVVEPSAQAPVRRVARAAWRIDDAILLAERAGYE